MSSFDLFLPAHRSLGSTIMDANRNNFPHQGHVKDEPLDEYEPESAQEVRLAAILPEPRESWANSQPEGLRQTLGSSHRDINEIARNEFRAALDAADYSLPSYPSASNGNTFHIPPFRFLAETAGAGEYRSSSPPMLPMMQPSGQASQMPPDGAFLHASKSSSRNPSWLTQQYNLPYFAAQSSAYSLDSGHAYPTDMPAPRMVTHTVDPSTLLHSQIPMHMLRAESFSESEAEVDNEGESDCNWDHQFDNDDAAGWRYHPGTIGIGIPDFDDTKIKGDMRDAAGLQVSVVMHARWVLKKRAAKQRGFWILYRRNYFGIQGSYQLKSLEDSSPDETLYLHRKNSKPEAIKTLFMCMRGVVDTEEGPEIKIVVFDAKRKPLHAGNEPPPIKPQRMKPLTEGSTKFYTESTGDRQDHMNVPMNHTFHRNQFRAATQNNGQRRTEQQYYHIVLELKAEIMVDGVPTLFTVASRISEPLVVRGRCPLSFKDKDKDKDGHTRDRGRKGRKQPRAGGGSGNKGGSTKQSQEEGQTKGQRKRASRSSSNKTGGCSRRSTRAASFNLPSLTYGTYGTRSRNTDTAPGSPQPNFGANGTVNRETIPRLDHKLLSLSGESWEGDWQWKRGDGPASEQHSKRFSKL